MRKILILFAELALAVVVVVPASAASDTSNGKGVTTLPGTYSGSIPVGLVSSMASTDWTGYTCTAVRETVVAGGLKDTQSCLLATTTNAGLPVVLPKHPTNYFPGPYTAPSFGTAPDTCGAPDYVSACPALWISDYQAAKNSVYWWADSWSYQIRPDGTVNITSFYAVPEDTCRRDIATNAVIGVCN